MQSFMSAALTFYEAHCAAVGWATALQTWLSHCATNLVEPLRYKPKGRGLNPR